MKKILLILMLLTLSMQVFAQSPMQMSDKGAANLPASRVFTGEVPYAVLKDSTLTFYYGKDKPSGAYEMKNRTELVSDDWNNVKEKIYKVVFDTSFAYYKPTSLKGLFEGYSNLTQIVGLENLNTALVVSMESMFRGCKKLTSVDICNFVVTQHTNCNKMFADCYNLKTIYVGDSWTINSFCYFVVSDSSNIDFPESTLFDNCYSLVGGKGTKYTVGQDYVQKDGGESSPGYLTYKNPYAYTDEQGNTTYAVLKDSTLTLYFDNNKPADAIEIGKWTRVSDKISNVVFDNSYRNYKPRSCKSLFAWLKKLKTIKGIKENLNTEIVTDFSEMFAGCRSLTTLDLSGFNTAKVGDMEYMFYNCNQLISLDLSGFNTARTNSMYGMFAYCNNLKTIYVDDKWSVNQCDTSDVMFYGCESLRGEKGTECLPGKETSVFARVDGGPSAPGYFVKKGHSAYSSAIDYKIKQPYVVFKNGVLTFYYNKKRPVDSYSWRKWDIPWSYYTSADITKVVFDKSFADYKLKSLEYWFAFCDKLTIIEGIEYLNTSEVANMDNLFAYCSNLANVDLSHFDTEQVTSMSGMFVSCNNITVLDLSSFNTVNVTNMSNMFSSCEKLTTIIASDSWNTSRVPEYDWYHRNEKGKIFSDCPNLIGGEGTRFDQSFAGKERAKIDGGWRCPGYFTRKKK